MFLLNIYLDNTQAIFQNFYKPLSFTHVHVQP